MRDIAEFFTRKKGEKLAGKPLESDFYGIVLEGIKGGSTFGVLWNNFMKNYGGDIVDAAGKPNFDTPENVAALSMWAQLWKFAPPGIAEYSLVDVPTVMGNGIAAQTIAWSDFVLGVDKPGVSPFAGKFVYAPVPVKAGSTARSAEAEPSVTVISAASKNAEPTFLFLEWLADKKQQDKLIALGQGGVPIRSSSWALPAIKDNPQQDAVRGDGIHARDFLGQAEDAEILRALRHAEQHRPGGRPRQDQPSGCRQEGTGGDAEALHELSAVMTARVR